MNRSEILVSKGQRTLTVSAVAVGLADVAGGAPADYNFVRGSVEGAAVRARDDGVDPTSSVGHALYPGDTFELDASALDKVKFIRKDVSDATLQLGFYLT